MWAFSVKQLCGYHKTEVKRGGCWSTMIQILLSKRFLFLYFALFMHLIILMSHKTPGRPPAQQNRSPVLAGCTTFRRWEGEKEAGWGKPVKPERKWRMWSGEQTAASRELPLCLAFFLLLPPDPAASLTTSPPLEKHKQLKSPHWARASQNTLHSLVRTRGNMTRITRTSFTT